MDLYKFIEYCNILCSIKNFEYFANNKNTMSESYITYIGYLCKNYNTNYVFINLIIFILVMIYFRNIIESTTFKFQNILNY